MGIARIKCLCCGGGGGVTGACCFGSVCQSTIPDGTDDPPPMTQSYCQSHGGIFYPNQGCGGFGGVVCGSGICPCAGATPQTVSVSVGGIIICPGFDGFGQPC